MINSEIREEDFSEIIANNAGIPLQKEESKEIRKEHNRWKQEVSAIKKSKSTEPQSYWQTVSSCVAL